MHLISETIIHFFSISIYKIDFIECISPIFYFFGAVKEISFIHTFESKLVLIKNFLKGYWIIQFFPANAWHVFCFRIQHSRQLACVSLTFLPQTEDFKPRIHLSLITFPWNSQKLWLRRMVDGLGLLCLPPLFYISSPGVWRERLVYGMLRFLIATRLVLLSVNG